MSHVRLFATPWTIHTVHEIFQARILKWVAIPFSRDSWPRDQTQVSCTAGRFFTIWATRSFLLFCPFFLHISSFPNCLFSETAPISTSVQVICSGTRKVTAWPSVQAAANQCRGGSQTQAVPMTLCWKFWLWECKLVSLSPDGQNCKIKTNGPQTRYALEPPGGLVKIDCWASSQSFWFCWSGVGPGILHL